MKIVIPVGDLHTGGGCKVIVDMARAFVNEGHEVELVMPKIGSVHYELPCKLTLIPSLSKEYIPYGDIVIPNFYTTFRPAYEAWPKQCIRLSLGFEPFWVPNRAEAIWSYQQGVPTIAISNWLDEQIYRISKQRSRVVSLGIDPTIFHPHVRGIKPTKQKVILYIARDPKAGYALKGFDDFAQSMQLVKQQLKEDFIVHMICPSTTLSLPGVPFKIFKPQSAEEMAQLYRSADLFVSTSWFEGFSLPPLEAMACGTPVVTTNSGGVMDFCKHHHNSYITTPKDPASIAKGVVAVLSNPILAQLLVKGGLESAQRFTHQAFEKNIVKTVLELSSTRR